jgi:hypothetical protein
MKYEGRSENLKLNEVSREPLATSIGQNTAGSQQLADLEPETQNSKLDQS